jgi:hypothetical protein
VTDTNNPNIDMDELSPAELCNFILYRLALALGYQPDEDGIITIDSPKTLIREVEQVLLSRRTL